MMTLSPRTPRLPVPCPTCDASRQSSPRGRVGTPHEIANELSINTAHGVERVVRYAFALAQKR